MEYSWHLILGWAMLKSCGDAETEEKGEKFFQGKFPSRVFLPWLTTEAYRS